jgi:hypothetical protein
VLVVHFAGDALGARLGDEFYFADEISAPSLIDTLAEFFFHRLELFLPGFAVGHDFEAPGFAADGFSMRRENLPYDLRPRAGEPCESGFGAVESPQHTAKKFSGTIHGWRILAQTVDATNI